MCLLFYFCSDTQQEIWTDRRHAPWRGRSRDWKSNDVPCFIISFVCFQVFLFFFRACLPRTRTTRTHEGEAEMNATAGWTMVVRFFFLSLFYVLSVSFACTLVEDIGRKVKSQVEGWCNFVFLCMHFVYRYPWQVSVHTQPKTHAKKLWRTCLRVRLLVCLFVFAFLVRKCGQMTSV